MASSDRRYDFGLRGYQQTTRPITDDRYGGRYGYRFSGDADERAHPEQRLAHRVTARYNRDYVDGPARPGYDRGFNETRADGPDDMPGEYYTRGPFWTVAGSRTMRGAPFRTRYDYPDYRPNYGTYPERF